MVLQGITDTHFHSAVARLVKDISPAAIVCFGHTFSVITTSSCFQENSSEHHHYDFLIVRSQADQRKDHEIIDLVKSQFANNLSVNVLSHSEPSVLSALRYRHPFFHKIFSEGIVVHQSEHFHYEISNDIEEDAGHDQPGTAHECKRSFELSQHFLILAADALSDGIYDIGVFLLHQAMEQMCIASIKAHLQYRPSTHNIANLLALVSCSIPQARTLFPRNTTGERELFDFLKKSYSDVRYKEFYHVPAHVAFSLLERVGEFHRLLKETYQKEFLMEEARDSVS